MSSVSVVSFNILNNNHSNSVNQIHSSLIVHSLRNGAKLMRRRVTNQVTHEITGPRAHVFLSRLLPPFLSNKHLLWSIAPIRPQQCEAAVCPTRNECIIHASVMRPKSSNRSLAALSGISLPHYSGNASKLWGSGERTGKYVSDYFA